MVFLALLKIRSQKERFKELYLTYCSLSASFLDVLEPVEMENLLKVECLFFNKTNLLRQIRLILHIYHPWFFKTLTKKQQFNFFKTIITKTYEIGSYHYIKKLFSLTHDLEGRLIVDNLTFSFE